MRLAMLAAALCLLAVGCGAEGRQSTAPTAPARETTLGTTGPALRKPPRVPSVSSAAELQPRIKQTPIPFGGRRRQETVAYAQRHYGKTTATLDPKVIVEHYTVTPALSSVIATFSRDVPDTELHELPAVCSHFVIDRDGTIYQLVPVRLMCRHTVGLNDVAIGIEHVGASDAEVLGNAAQLDASIRLTSWLRCRYGISVRNVIGHAESLSSPYHHERVAALRNQTHSDFQRGAMDQYRARLEAKRC